MNDMEFSHITPEQRYTRMLEWAERHDAILANQRNCRDEYLSRSPGIGPLTAEAHGAALGMSDWIAEELEILREEERLP